MTDLFAHLPLRQWLMLGLLLLTIVLTFLALVGLGGREVLARRPLPMPHKVPDWVRAKYHPGVHAPSVHGFPPRREGAWLGSESSQGWLWQEEPVPARLERTREFARHRAQQ